MGWIRLRGSNLPRSELPEEQVCSTVMGNDKQDSHWGQEAAPSAVCIPSGLEDLPQLHIPRPYLVQVFSPLLLCWEAVALTGRHCGCPMGSIHTRTAPFPLYSVGAVTFRKDHDFSGVLSTDLKAHCYLGTYVLPVGRGPGPHTRQAPVLHLSQDEDGEKNKSEETQSRLTRN